ncbi:hypothetical protein JCM1840_001759 [Sporobolomyces johnsonii]
MRGERLAVAIVDVATRYLWTETVATKATIPGLVVQRLKRLRQASADADRIIALQTDNGTKFINKALGDYLSDAGIQHRRTVPYVHGQNGFVERRWRSLLETTRALLADSGLALSFWPFALASATYLYNRSPTIALPSSITPYEAYHGHPPDLSNLRAWGCDSKGWLFWVPEQRRIVVAWNASFLEDEFTNERTAEEEHGLDHWLGAMEGVDGEEPRPSSEEEAGHEHGGRRTDGAEEPEEEEATPPPPSQTDDDEDHQEPARSTPSPATPEPRPPSSSPPTPPPPPPRRSSRLAGVAGDDAPFYRPLQGAPPKENPIPDSLAMPDGGGGGEVALSTFALASPNLPPPPTLSLSHATHALDLESDPTASIAFAFEVTDQQPDRNLKATFERALATSPPWSGSLDEPSFWQAMEGPDVEKWTMAMEAELAAFEATGTWEDSLVEPPGREKSDRRKFDISNAYLLGTLDNEIYIKQPPGFVDPAGPRAVRRLRKALYGLRQGGREWQKVLRAALESVGFKRSSADHGLYVRREGGRVAIVPTHVDDGMMVGDDDLDDLLERLSTALQGKLKKVETDLFLGMRIRRKVNGLVEADQGHYTRAVLDRFFPSPLTPRTTPLDADYSKISPATEEERYNCRYRELLGALVYLSACTRPDIAFAFSFASRFAACPAEWHWRILVRVCRYLAGTSHLGLRYTTPSSPFSADLLTAWSDADHAADKESRRSVSGFVFAVGDDSLRSTAISWMSRRQRSVAISSTEAEYMALSEAAREAIWLHSLLDLGFPPTSPTTIRGDNSGSLLLSAHPTSHSRTKHIAVHYHFTRDKVEEGVLVLKWVSTEDMVADVFTKGLGGVKHTLFTARCGLRDVRREGGCDEVDRERGDRGERGEEEGTEPELSEARR